MDITLNTPLTDFPGVGPARSAKLEKLGLTLVRDLMTYFPRDYEDRRKIWSIRSAPLGVKVCVQAMAAEHPRLSRIRKGMELVKVKAVDHAGALHITFFNQSYVERAIQAGEEYVFWGVVEEQGSRRTMVNPIFERTDRQAVTGCILPVYPLTAGISNHLLCSLIRPAVEACASQMPESLPRSVRLEHELAQTEFSFRNIHFPDSPESLDLARRRLAFEELFLFTIGLERLRSRREVVHVPPCGGVDMELFYRALPFTLTDAQRRCVEEALADMRSGTPMNRLCQGDVGSGKTMVAAACVYFMVKNGRQAALMAPTEILAQQHYQGLAPLLENLGIRCALLTGSTTAKTKRSITQQLESGEIDFAIGTHALITGSVAYRDLGLVVTDEQHRFGVAQRAELAAKGDHPHILVMSATPIPRTLALILYGDLDVSIIDQLPPGRQPVQTFAVTGGYHQRVYRFIRKLVGEGRQAYIVCPMVEENDQLPDERKAVTEYAKKLQSEVFPDLKVAFVHGKMKPKEKDAVMAAFAAHETDILVSTTVIEVGVDVPNAAVMVIENAERFGLSQLHQLRGRVGRGKHQSYCILISDNRNEETRQRLKVMTKTTDGFQIAEEDLRLRGPGDFFGRRQHGLPTLRLADLSGDMRLLSEAQQAARDLLSADPRLALGENRPVLERVRALFSDTPDIFN